MVLEVDKRVREMGMGGMVGLEGMGGLKEVGEMRKGGIGG